MLDATKLESYMITCLLSKSTLNVKPATTKCLNAIMMFNNM